MSPDLRDTIGVFLPILWAVVAAGVALLLYKTSKSFLNGLDMPGMPLKGLRIAGSVVIFVVVFLLLKASTPSSSGTTIAEADLMQLRSTAEQVEAASQRLIACIRLHDGAGGCEEQARRVQSEAASVMSAIDRIRPER